MTERKVVPREPTEAMMQAAYEDWNNHSGAGKPRSAAEGMRAKWRAMYDAAPAAPAPPENRCPKCNAVYVCHCNAWEGVAAR